MIIIEKPEVIILNNKARLQADFNIDGQRNNIWYEVDLVYKEYLCFERSDAFVISLLLLAMQKGQDIKCEQVVSEQLYFNLTKYLIPFLLKINPDLKEINLICELDNSILNSKREVGTGISGGVDSLSTILYHGSETRSKSYIITHLTLFNSGYYGNREDNTERFKEYAIQSEKFSNEFKYPLLLVDSNISNVTKYNFLASHTYLSCSVVLAMQKFFNVYYYASGYAIYYFEANFEDSAYYDFFLLDCISTENVKFISANSTMSRVEKTKLILENENYLKHLYVCFGGKPPINCGKCEKCVRTLLAIDSMGMLEKVTRNFDIKVYKARRSLNIASMLLKKNKNIFYRENYDSFKLAQISIPIKAYFLIPFAYLHDLIFTKLRRYLKSKLNHEQQNKLKQILKKTS